MWCVVCVVRVVVVIVVVWCVVVFGVWCGTQKKPPCVDSKRPRVYRHHARMCQNMRVVPVHTGTFLNVHTEVFWTDTRRAWRRGGRRGEGGVTVSSAYQDWST